jgi:hypothetical protein
MPVCRAHDACWRTQPRNAGETCPTAVLLISNMNVTFYLIDYIIQLPGWFFVHSSSKLSEIALKLHS